MGLLETPQVSYLVIIPIHHEPGKKGAGVSGQLIAGHMGQAKSQWAAGEVAAVLSFQQSVHAQQRPDLPLVSSPAPGVFSRHLSRTTKDRDCQHQGSVFNVTLTAVTTVNIREPKGKRRTSLGQVGGRRLRPLSARPGAYRNSLLSTVGAQPAETWCPNQGSCHQRCRVWRGSPWRWWACDPRCRVWRGSPWRWWTCVPRCRV